MKRSLFVFTFILAGLLTTPVMAQNQVESATAGKVVRNYPHGQDEEDLKVQPEIVRPVVVVDRKTIEQKVLKNFLKKSTEDEAQSPSSTPKTQ